MPFIEVYHKIQLKGASSQLVTRVFATTVRGNDIILICPSNKLPPFFRKSNLMHTLREGYLPGQYRQDLVPELPQYRTDYPWDRIQFSNAM